MLPKHILHIDIGIAISRIHISASRFLFKILNEILKKVFFFIKERGLVKKFGTNDKI